MRIETNTGYEVSVADRLAINETIASYGHTYDRRNGVGFAELFEPDGQWDAYPNKATRALISLKGRDVIAEFANDRQKMFTDVGIETKHFMLDIVVTSATDSEVHCSAMALILWQRPLDGDPLPRPVQTGYYNFVLRSSESGWKFHQVNVLTSGYYRPDEVYSVLQNDKPG